MHIFQQHAAESGAFPSLSKGRTGTEEHWLFAAFAKWNNIYIALYIIIPLEPYLCSLGKCKSHIHFLISPFYRHSLASSTCIYLQNALKSL